MFVRKNRSPCLPLDYEAYQLTLTCGQVGKPYHATPVFKDTMRYLDFNPTWTIPPGILRKETLPAIRRDPDYLRKNNMSVVTMAGKVVDPSTIDWPATASKGFSYMIRQEPGPWNALGRVKFMFPNTFMVYLHDTPSKAKKRGNNRKLKTLLFRFKGVACLEYGLRFFVSNAGRNRRPAEGR